MADDSRSQSHRVRPKTLRYPFEGEIAPQAEASARVTFFDAAVGRFLPGIDQFVILGAGFDTRSYRLPADTPVRSFELDPPQTQATKREVLGKAGIGTGKVSLVGADFETEDWLEKSMEAGFDTTRPALFLLDGVIIYLDSEAAEDTLREVAICAKGSVLAFDCNTTETLGSTRTFWRYARAATKSAGEPLRFGVDATPPSRERLAELLGSCGLALLEQRTLGAESDTERAWGGFAAAVVE